MKYTIRMTLACVLVLALASACVNIPRELAELHPVGNRGTLTLSEGLYLSKGIYLARGTYVAETENSFGVLFRAQGYPVVNTGRSDEFIGYPGGIWVPRNGGKPRAFVIMGESRVYTTLDSALAPSSHGRVPEKDAGSINSLILSTPALQTGTPLQAGVAAGVSGALVEGVADAIAEEERGKAHFSVEIDRATLRERVSPAERENLR